MQLVNAVSTALHSIFCKPAEIPSDADDETFMRYLGGFFKTDIFPLDVFSYLFAIPVFFYSALVSAERDG